MTTHWTDWTDEDAAAEMRWIAREALALSKYNPCNPVLAYKRRARFNTRKRTLLAFVEQKERMSRTA